MRDLNIRGAGNLLGNNNTALLILSVSTYIHKCLKKPLMRNVVLKTPDAPEVEVELNLDAYLPAEYIQNEQAKIEIYKKLRKVETEDQLFDVKDELIDRFNDYPVEVERLLDIVEIKVHALHAGITLIKDKGKTVEISLSNKATENINGEELFKQTQPLGRAMKVGVQENAMRVTLTKSKQWLDSLKFLVKCIEESMAIEDEA